jgi:enoyl-CoA hydratase
VNVDGPAPLATRFAVEGAVGWVELNRPDAANSRNQQMRAELKAIWSELAADPAISVVVLTAAGDRFFCAGMDLKEAGAPESPAARRDRLRSSRDIEMLAALPQVTIAAVNGYALGGGCEMALACDLRVAAETAQIGLTELAHGLVPGGGGTQRLPRILGPTRAAEMIFTGRRLSGSEALDWGLVNRCVPLAELRDTARELAEQIAGMPGRALRYAKELVRRSQEVPLAAGVDLELDALLMLMADRQSET